MPIHRKHATAASSPTSERCDRSTIPFEGQFGIIAPTETMRRKRVRMGARYQQGNIMVLDGWVYCRYRIDTPNGRKRVTERICPASGKGLLSVAVQRRRAAEIIMASKVNEATTIMEKSGLGTSFRQQAEWFLRNVRTRTRKPVASSTLVS